MFLLVTPHMIGRLFLAYVNCLQRLEILYEKSLVVRKLVFGVSWARSDTNRAVQPQKMARGLKFSDLERRGIVLST